MRLRNSVKRLPRWQKMKRHKTQLLRLKSPRKRRSKSSLLWRRAKQPTLKRSKRPRRREESKPGLWSGTCKSLYWCMPWLISPSRSLDNFQFSRFMELLGFMDLERSGVMTRRFKIMTMFTSSIRWLIITQTTRKLDWNSKQWTSSCNFWAVWSSVSSLSNAKSSCLLATKSTFLKQVEAWTCFAS